MDRLPPRTPPRSALRSVTFLLAGSQPAAAREVCRSRTPWPTASPLAPQLDTVLVALLCFCQAFSLHLTTEMFMNIP